MINQCMLEGYVVTDPELKQAYEKDNMNYVRFRFLHYSGKQRCYFDCISFHDHLMEYILQNVLRQERILVTGKVVSYRYKDPSNKTKLIMSIIISPNGLRKILTNQDTPNDIKQEIGKPGGHEKSEL